MGGIQVEQQLEEIKEYPVLILSVLQNVGMTYNVTRQKTAHFLQKIREKAKNRQYLTENVHIW